MNHSAMGNPKVRSDNVGGISNVKNGANSDDIIKMSTIKMTESGSKAVESVTEIAKLREQLQKSQNEVERLTAEAAEVKNQLDLSNVVREKLKVHNFHLRKSY